MPPICTQKKHESLGHSGAWLALACVRRAGRPSPASPKAKPSARAKPGQSPAAPWGFQNVRPPAVQIRSNSAPPRPQASASPADSAGQTAACRAPTARPTAPHISKRPAPRPHGQAFHPASSGRPVTVPTAKPFAARHRSGSFISRLPAIYLASACHLSGVVLNTSVYLPYKPAISKNDFHMLKVCRACAMSG